MDYGVVGYLLGAVVATTVFIISYRFIQAAYNGRGIAGSSMMGHFHGHGGASEEASQGLPTFTLEDLKPFTGADGGKIYMAMRNKVYDVTKGKDFYGPEGGYHFFAGKNPSRALAKLSFEVEEVDNQRLDDLTEKEIDVLDDWVNKLSKKYPVVGNFVETRDYTKEELKAFDGQNGGPVFIAIMGKIYDVSSSRSFYGPGQSYNLFAGKDATRALAKMSFEEEDLENTNVDDLSAFERDTLSEWREKFEYKYKCIGRVKDSSPAELGSEAKKAEIAPQE